MELLQARKRIFWRRLLSIVILCVAGVLSAVRIGLRDLQMPGFFAISATGTVTEVQTRACSASGSELFQV